MDLEKYSLWWRWGAMGNNEGAINSGAMGHRGNIYKFKRETKIEIEIDTETQIYTEIVKDKGKTVRIITDILT